MLRQVRHITKLKYFLVAWTLMSSTLSIAQEWVAKEGYTYQSDEQLFYNVYFKTGFFWFSIGEVSFETKEIEEGLQLKVIAYTHPKWQKLYAFNSTFTSVLDSTDCYPLSYVRKSVEKGNSVFDSIQFTSPLTAHEFVSNNDGELHEYELELTKAAYDMISLFYRFRSLDFSVAEENDFQQLRLLHNRREYDIAIAYKGAEEKKVKKLGKFQSHKLEINTIKGLHFDDKQVMSMWLADDDSRTPMVVETDVKLGGLRIVLRQ